MSYVDRAVKRPPRTLTEAEQDRVLKVTGESRAGFRDHVIISLALSTALRTFELIALNVGDVSDDPFGADVKRTIQLRVWKKGKPPKAKKARAAAAAELAKLQYVRLSDAAYYKLVKWMKVNFRDKGFKPSLDHPLFWARGHRYPPRRLSTRQIREMWRKWQRLAKIHPLTGFHCLRHTAITNVYRTTKNIRVAQRVGRHANIETTTRYEHASDEDVASAVKGLKS